MHIPKLREGASVSFEAHGTSWVVKRVIHDTYSLRAESGAAVREGWNRLRLGTLGQIREDVKRVLIVGVLPRSTKGSWA